MFWSKKKKTAETSEEMVKATNEKESLRDRVHVVGEYIRQPEIIALLEKGFCVKKRYNEEATKQLSVIPFIRSLGYDNVGSVTVFPEALKNPDDANGKKVDYAISVDGRVRILVEAKAFVHDLDKPQNGELPLEQLAGYFESEAFANAKYAILTNGKEYRFYCQDAESAVFPKPRKMSLVPFLTLDLSKEATEYSDILEAVSLQGYTSPDSIASVKAERKQAADAAVKNVLSSLQSDDEFMQMLRKKTQCSSVITDKELLDIFTENINIEK